MRVCCTCSGEHPLHHANWHHTSPTIIVTFAQKYPLSLLFAYILTDERANHKTTECVLVYSKIITKCIFSLSHYLFIESEKMLASFGTVIGNLCSESPNRISEDLKY